MLRRKGDGGAQVGKPVVHRLRGKAVDKVKAHVFKFCLARRCDRVLHIVRTVDAAKRFERLA